MATTTSGLPGAGETIAYNQPQYYTDTGTQFAGGVQDLLGNSGYINDIANNWFGGAAGQGGLQQMGTWNAANQQQFMNPYTQNVVNEQARLSNQNLFQNVLPGVNSTFTGAGQFGSSRNADFTNRAINDQQQTLAGQQAQTLMNAQNQAAQQYGDWTKTQMGGAQSDLTNWLQQANFPLSALGQVGQMFGQMRPAQAQTVSNISPDQGNLAKLGQVLGVLNTGLNDSTINSLLNWAGLGGALD